MIQNRTAFIVLILAGQLVGGTRAARANEDFTITPDVVYGHKAGMALTFDMIRPEKQNGAAVLFMMSGGWYSVWLPPEGFVGANAPNGFRHFGQLVDKGYTLFIVRHGSAPQFKVPEAVADVRRAVRFIRANAEKFGIDSDRIGVCGGSAGGHLSLMLGTTADDGNSDAKDDIERESDRVAVVVAYFPPVDLRDFLTLKDRFPALDFDPTLAESVSPLLAVTSDDAPTLLIHGDKDDLVKLSQSERIHDAFEREHVPCELIVVEGAGHGFNGDDAARAGSALMAWFDKYLAAKDGDQGKHADPPAKPEKAADASR
jgi:acetyl esterase/lipase